MLFGLALVAPGSILAQESVPVPVAQRITETKLFPEPLQWTRQAPIEEKETQELWAALETLQQGGYQAGFPVLEQFLTAHPDSGWAPALRSTLAQRYRETGRYTLALNHWEKAWETVKTADEVQARAIADYTLANWTQLLASLGRVEKLETVFQEAGERTLADSRWQQLYQRSRTALKTMKARPGISYRCGTAAMFNMLNALPGQQRLSQLLLKDSPEGGFSVAELVAFAAEGKVEVEAVRRNSGTDLPVPSVVHWQQNHYAAIVRVTNGLYQVIDPTFGRSRWLRAEAINAEASGTFIVPKQELAANWTVLTQEEAAAIRGKGENGAPAPPPAPPCPEEGQDACECSGPGAGGTGGDAGGNSGAGAGAGAGGGTGDGGDGGSDEGTGPEDTCDICNSGLPWEDDSEGMPTWLVSEPQVQLWLKDRPMFYRVPRQGKFALDLTYQQNGTRPLDPDIFNLGRNWNCNWLTYLTLDATEADFSDFANVVLYGSRGGERYYDFTNESTPENRARTKLIRIFNGANVVGFKMEYPNGSQAIYGQLVADGVNHYQAFLTARLDRTGLTNSVYRYSTTGGRILLTQVLDEIGQTNIVRYDTNVLARIREIENPFGAKVTFKYGSDGLLTNLTDVVNIASSFTYTWWTTNDPVLTKLTTPYGDTAFEWLDPLSQLYGQTDNDNINRALVVTTPIGGKHLFMYRDNSITLARGGDYIDFIPPAYTDRPDNAVVPVAGYYDSDPAGSAGLDGISNYLMYYRNSFHWGPRQYALLSTTNLLTLSTNDYQLARLRNWLHAPPVDAASFQIGDMLNMERAPWSDSTHDGQKTWYGHKDKPGPIWQGTSTKPNWIAQLLPDGSTRYVFLEYNSLNFLTNRIATYLSSTGTIGTRTNRYVFAANDVDLRYHIGPDGVTNSLTGYDSYHRPLNVTNAVGDVWSYTYSSSGLLSSFKRPSGWNTTNLFFANGYLDKRIDFEVISGTNFHYGTNSFTYTNGLPYTRTDRRGLTRTNTWDALNRLTSVRFPDGSYRSNSFALTNRPLNVSGRRDRLGNWTYFGYNSVRQRTSITNALNNVVGFNYCSCGALDSVTDAENRTTSFFYDQLGRRTGIVYPGGSWRTNRYNALNQVTNVADIAGVSVTNWFNHQGRLIAVSNAFGQVFKVVLDIRDRATNAVTPDGVTLAGTYDVLSRLTSTTYPDGGVETFAHTIRGLTAYTNQLGTVTRYGYDVFGRALTETNAKSEVTLYSYNSAGDLLSLRDGRSKFTYWGYDAYGRVTSKTNHSNTKVLEYKYDARGQLTNRWSLAKTNTYYAYDAVGNLTNVNYPVSPDVAFAFDKNSRLKTMVDGVGSSSYTYADFGALLTEDGPWSDDTVTYGYTSARRRQSLAIALPAGPAWTQTYAYDSSGRLDDTTSPAGTFDYLYDTTRKLQVQKLTLPNSAAITNGFDSLARLTKTHLRNSGGTLLNQHDYTVNTGNQRTKQTRLAGDYLDYTYDDIGQLETAIGKETGGGTNRLQERFGYSYDTGGNLARRTNNLLVQTFTVDDLNQLNGGSRSGTLTVVGTSGATASSVTVNGSGAQRYADNTFTKDGFTVTNGNNAFTAIATDNYGRSATNTVTAYLPASPAYSYDGNGNLLSDGLRSFTYDDENQLLSVLVTNAWKSEFVYDGLFRRRIRKEYSWTGSAWQQTNEVRYVYDLNLAVQERNVLNVPVVTYTRGRDLSGSHSGAGGIGGLLARSSEAETGTVTHAYYHADGGGNVTVLLDAQQAVVARYLYDPYGMLLASSGPLAEANLYRFSSKEFHANSGLSYYLYRYYDPTLQRWINRDPIEETGGNNLYRFNYNSPIGVVDLFGLDSYSAYTMPVRNAPYLGAPGYTDPFGNWSPTFCLSCHGNTPTSDFLKQQSELANMLDYRALAYQQLLGAGLAAGLGAIAEDMAAAVQASRCSTFARMGKGIVQDGKVVAHAPIESVTSHEQMAIRSGTLLHAPQAGTPGSLVPGAEAFTYSELGENLIVTGSMNFNSNVNRNTVAAVTIFIKKL